MIYLANKYNINFYDIMTSFGITHVFVLNALLYLIKLISNKSKYCYLHIGEHINIQDIKNYFDSQIEIIDTFVENIAAGPGANIWYYIFIKFDNKINISEYKNIKRTDNFFHLY